MEIRNNILNDGENEMSIDVLREYVYYGREIEFDYQNKKFSITYGKDPASGDGHIISLCEFYQEIGRASCRERV